MKKLSIRLKITLWFSILILLIVALTYAVVLSSTDSVMRNSAEDKLLKAIESDADEIEFSKRAKDSEDHYLPYGTGYLEIDVEYENNINGISVALYRQDGTLLYGENPIAEELANAPFADAKVQNKIVSGSRWYFLDQKLTDDKLEGLWLRGVVSAESEAAQLTSTVRISIVVMPLLLVLAILGGYILAGKMLKPMKKMAMTANQITEGRDLKKRISIGDGKDEVHQLADSFNKMLDCLDRSFETERQFISDASHELRTPMAVIMAQCEYILEESRSPEEYCEALGVIRRQGGRMSHLIEDMLTFTRMERKSDSYELSQLDFSQLVASVAEDMALLRSKNIVVETAIEPDICVRGNALLLTRLLTNLISNAYRYGKEDGHTLVTLQRDGETCVLSVSDDGIGISSENQERIFHRFFQVDHSRTGGGNGLGLSMAREIVQFHAGTILVESGLGSGSKFSVRFKRMERH